MAEVTEATIIDYHDWQALYLGERLVFEDHNIDLRDYYSAVKGLPHTLTLVRALDQLEDHVLATGESPSILSEARSMGVR